MAAGFDLLCDELLIKIFSYLPLWDLFSVSNVDTRFQKIAGDDRQLINIKSLDFKNTHTVISNICGENSMKINDENNIVEISGSLAICRYISFFNEKIERIDVQCLGASRKDCSRIFHYIRLFLPNLNELKISNLYYDIIRLPRSNKVSVLYITSCRLSERMCNLTGLFPLIKTLFIEGSCAFEEISFIIDAYPNLLVMGLPDSVLNEDIHQTLTLLNPGSLIVGLENGKMTFYN